MVYQCNPATQKCPPHVDHHSIRWQLDRWPFCFLRIPRRPDVYRNGSIVDRQNTVSILGKFTFAWPTSATCLRCQEQRSVIMMIFTRSITNCEARILRESFEAVGKKDQLWKAIFFSHKKQFIMQWTLQAICSITNFFPQIALLYILRTLERRDAGEDISFKAWLLVIALGASVTISSWIEAWMFFIVFMKIGIPVYEMIAAVVFGKAIRRKRRQKCW